MKKFIFSLLLPVCCLAQNSNTFTKKVDAPGVSLSALYSNALTLRVGVFDSCQVLLPQTGQEEKIVILEKAHSSFLFYNPQSRVQARPSFLCDLTVHITPGAYQYSLKLVSHLVSSVHPNTYRITTDVLPVKNFIPEIEYNANLFGKRVKNSQALEAEEAYQVWLLQIQEKIEAAMGAKAP